jgi:hypothetical protein
MIEIDLHLEPNEASDLCSVFDAQGLARLGWDRALVTVLDEANGEDALAVLAHVAGAPLEDGWRAMRVKATPADKGDKGRTEDAEACAARDGYVYVVGSQFGKKAGPLSARRSWIARVSQSSLAGAIAGGGPAELEIARTRFGLHRAVNDALAAAGLDLLPLGPLAREVYIDETIAIGAKKGKRWAGRVKSGDQPLNVEAADFRADGRLLLGLRYPVTADGHPILVELHDVEALFEDPDSVPRAGAVWVLEDAGTAAEPVGFRALDSSGTDTFDAVVGDLDASGKSATVLEDHPHGGKACSEHRRFSLPLTAGGGSVTSELIHHFGDVRRVEGVAIDHEGHVHYVIDEEGHVALRTLLVDA